LAVQEYGGHSVKSFLEPLLRRPEHWQKRWMTS
jgi:hypothetical protein